MWKKNLQPNTKKQQRRWRKGRHISLRSPWRILLSWNITESKICYYDQGMYSWSFWIWIYRSSLAQTLSLSGLKLSIYIYWKYNPPWSVHTEPRGDSDYDHQLHASQEDETPPALHPPHLLLEDLWVLTYHINFTPPKENHYHQKDFLNTPTDKGSQGAVKDTMLQRHCLECRRHVVTYTISIQITADQPNLQKFLHGAARC